MSARRFRKKPIEIEALYFDDSTDAYGPRQWNRGVGGDLWQWLTDSGADFEADEDQFGRVSLIIKTLEGDMRADVGDWIIRGVKGEFYPCKADIFAATYEEVTS